MLLISAKKVLPKFQYSAFMYPKVSVKSILFNCLVKNDFSKLKNSNDCRTVRGIILQCKWLVMFSVWEKNVFVIIDYLGSMYVIIQVFRATKRIILIEFVISNIKCNWCIKIMLTDELIFHQFHLILRSFSTSSCSILRSYFRLGKHSW